MPTTPNNKHMTVDGIIDVLGDLQDKADGRFAQGGGITFSVDNSTLAAEDDEGNPISFPGGGGGGGATQNALAYTMLAANWSNGVYSFENEYPSSAYNVSISTYTGTSAVQRAAFNDAKIEGNLSSNMVTALGVVPTIDIPVMLVVTTSGDGSGARTATVNNIQINPTVAPSTEGAIWITTD